MIKQINQEWLYAESNQLPSTRVWRNAWKN